MTGASLSTYAEMLAARVIDLIRNIPRINSNPLYYSTADEVSGFLQNQAAHDAMDIPSAFRELFVRCGEVWDRGCVLSALA
jgi:hypothetical protein